MPNAEIDAPCPKCVEKWGQMPHAWGESKHEMDAYDEHMREHGIPPVVGTCPDCGQPVTRDQPAWGPRGGPVHYDPCPIPPGSDRRADA